ncbi:hypothetical protein DVH24_016402 [Malus domestica]|uniref:Uncharacterized protein n=1 Tax=Malus domestica TaxID=3750 RepID=A0A498HS64_MALDO|nr:hypothetical protein DVH24_016402 [Malus domestica]
MVFPNLHTTQTLPFLCRQIAAASAISHGYLIQFYCLCVFAISDWSLTVHGSLARAGKVRGQTPKVAKQDKKKKPRGRAHKRLQYNRRFVTAGKLSSSFSSLPQVSLDLGTKGLIIWMALIVILIGFAVVGFGKKRGPNSSEKHLDVIHEPPPPISSLSVPWWNKNSSYTKAQAFQTDMDESKAALW